MTVLKCKVCGGQIVVDAQHSVAVCEYCGVKQSLPMFSDNSAQLLYDRGNHYLQNNEYDKAENIFNQLLAINHDKSELYWNLILCKYGVTYVCDPATGKYIPTCNRTHYQSVFNDENYQKALKLAVPEKAALYKSDAKTIDNIQKGILTVSKKEKPFDIFISYKETDANGNRTKDSLVAQSLYEKLTEAGYKVFFSRITLEDKIGTEYEPYIYAALYSSKVMLAIGSCKENFEAVWVKNEWSRFLNLRQNDASKTLIPLYFYMSQYELPKEFSILQPQDMDTEQFDKELLRGIKKLIPLPVMLAAKRKKVKKVITAVVATLCAVAVATVAMLTPKFIQHQKYGEQYKAAEQLYYDGNYPEATWAFDEIIDYKDSAEMKEKAELSWRKSLATVYGVDYECGYYINENGTVSVEKGAIGNADSGMDISKNGEIISIKCNDYYSSHYGSITALHENGHVTNKQIDTQIVNNSEWYDIVKVSDSLQNMGIVGLRADGKMVTLPYQQTVITADGKTETRQAESDILKELSTWSDIVDFKHNFHGGNGENLGLMVGLKTDGTLCAIQLSNNGFLGFAYDMDTVAKILENFYNVKSFAIYSPDFYISSDMSLEITVVALTKDNKLLTYSDGEFTEADGKDICEVVSTDIVLKSNGDLIDLSSEKVLVRDIVY